MKVSLPTPFLSHMKELLGDEYRDFLRIYDQPAARGIRINTLKISVEAFQPLSPFSLSPIPWAKEGFYFEPPERPGMHPFHDAGLYYIQEPSAMAVIPILDPKPGEWVIDLAAAPGGKATHAAIRMNRKGLLVANEVHPNRAKAILENIERLGITNAIVTNHAPSDLALKWPERFDKVILDAPCSGEGMFRKDEESRREWSIGSVRSCAVRQKDLLNTASQLVKPGGLLIYSTCTFNRYENEEVIESFLSGHPSWHLEEIPFHEGDQRPLPNGGYGQAPSSGDPIPSGLPPSDLSLSSPAGMVRIWPHHLTGEGHFIALLKKTGDGDVVLPKMRRADSKRQIPIPNDLKEKVRQFFEDTIDPQWHFLLEGELRMFGEYLSLLPAANLNLDQIRTLRAGLLLGQWKKNRFEPSHALGMALPGEAYKHRLRLSPGEEQLNRFFRGETLPAPNDGSEGWVSLQVLGYPLGWGKKINGLIKNHYPKGLRHISP